MTFFACPCCGFLTRTEAEYGTYEFCRVCRWEDDYVQRQDPDYRGGANEMSLNEARQSYQRIGAISEREKQFVKPPREDQIPPRWPGQQPDILARVRFRTQSEGGRSKNIAGIWYSCPLLVDDRFFECRVVLDRKELDLGAVYDIPVKFVNKSEALSRLPIGQEFVLWEGINIADGRVIKVFHCK